MQMFAEEKIDSQLATIGGKIAKNNDWLRGNKKFKVVQSNSICNGNVRTKTRDEKFSSLFLFANNKNGNTGFVVLSGEVRRLITCSSKANSIGLACTVDTNYSFIRAQPMAAPHTYGCFSPHTRLSALLFTFYQRDQGTHLLCHWNLISI